jgi:hypothetical protein
MGGVEKLLELVYKAMVSAKKLSNNIMYCNI